MKEAEAGAPEGARLKRWQKLALGGVGCALAGGLAAVPWAASHAVTDSLVHDDAGPIPTDLSFTPGRSQLDLGIGGKIYNSQLESHGLGLDIKPSGPPEVLSALMDGDSPNVGRLVKRYADFYGDPANLKDGYKQAMAHEAKQQFIKHELEAGLPLAAMIGLMGALASREFRPKKAKQATATGLGLIMALSVGAAGYNIHDWQESGQINGKTYPISSLGGTSLAGSKTDNPALAVAIDTKLKPQITRLIGREQKDNQEFLAMAYQTIDQQLETGAINPPDGNETMVLALSDMHANRDMIKVYGYMVRQINERYGDGTVAFVVMCGDQTYGSSAAKSAVDAMAEIGDGDDYYILGNHDGKLTLLQSNGAGLKHINGSIVKTPAGLSILGSDDPELTKLGALFGFGENVPRPGDGLTEAEAGKKLAATASKGKVSIMMTHEGYEMAPIAGLSQDHAGIKAYDKWFAQSDDNSGVSPDDVPNQPASLELFGHWHHGNSKGHKRYRVVSNSDGTWSVVAELGTAGGAIGAMSLTKFSTPWTTPGKTAEATLFTFNNDSQLVTKLQDLTTSVEGEFMANQPIAIGSSDAQPYRLGKTVFEARQQRQDLAEVASQSKASR